MRTHIRLTTAVWLAILATGAAMAQSIAPPVAEYRGAKIDGMFELQNGNDYPMAVVLETKSFSVDDHGVVVYRPLDKGISISMGASSFVINSHDSRMVFYKAMVPSTPASFSIVPTMTKASAATGMRINYMLPHMIYAYQKDKLQKSDVRVTVETGVLRIQNLSQKLGRIHSVQTANQDLGGFPLFPGQTREMPVNRGKVNVTFNDGFKLSVE
jgi:hypothetical protein